MHQYDSPDPITPESLLQAVRENGTACHTLRQELEADPYPLFDLCAKFVPRVLDPQGLTDAERELTGAEFLLLLKAATLLAGELAQDIRHRQLADAVRSN